MKKGFTLIEVIVYVALTGYLFIMIVQLFLGFSQTLQSLNMLSKRLHSLMVQDKYMKDVYNLSSCISFSDHEILFSTRDYDCSWSFYKGLLIRREGLYNIPAYHWSKCTKSIAQREVEGFFVVHKRGALVKAIEYTINNHKGDTVFCAIRRGMSL